MSAKRQRRTFVDPRTGRRRRICGRCEVEKDLERDFAKAVKEPTGMARDYDYWCRGCRSEYTSAIAHRLRRDPLRGPIIRERERKRQLAFAQANREHVNAIARKSRRKRKRDPIRRARYAEYLRMAHRLKAEREGRVVTIHRRNVLRVADHLPRLPAGPLVDYLVRLAGHRATTIEVLAGELGFSSRRFREWRAPHAEVQFDVADRIITAAGALMWDVWSERGDLAA